MKKSSFFTPRRRIILVALAILVVGSASIRWYVSKSSAPIACTLEAKICPDGSYVGRTGPRCEFASCPTHEMTWNTYKDIAQGISFQYPPQLATQYIGTQEWPPKVSIRSGSFICNKGGSEITQTGMVVQRKVDNKNYCVTTQSEGAAGSIYTTYTYTTYSGGKLVTLQFTLRYPQCLNYDDPKQSECKAERESFDLDGIVDRIVQSVKSI